MTIVSNTEYSFEDQKKRRISIESPEYGCNKITKIRYISRTMPNEFTDGFESENVYTISSTIPENRTPKISTVSNVSVNLKRKLGLISAVDILLCSMIGSGIFVSPTSVLIYTKSVGLSLTIWFVSGVFVLLGALAYAELGASIHKAGGDYAYMMEAFLPYSKKFGSLPSFLSAWICIFITRPATLSVLALSIGKYVSYPLMEFACYSYHTNIVRKLIAATCILLITFVNCSSITWTSNLQKIFTLAKITAIFIIIGGGIYRLIQGHVEHFENAFQDTSVTAPDIAIALYNGLWAYDGWTSLNIVSEEVKDPHILLPRAIGIAIPLVTLCYISINVAYFTDMSPNEVIYSKAVASEFGGHFFPSLIWIIPILVSLSTFGTIGANCFTSGRLCFAAAREGHIFRFLGFIHIKRLTPVPALIFNALIALVMIIPGETETLIDFFSFSAWLSYGGTMLAFIILRINHKHLERPFKVPIIIPFIVLITALFLVIGPLFLNPKIQYLYAALYIALGVVVYIIFEHFHISFKFLEKLSVILQAFLQIAPSEAKFNLQMVETAF